MIAAFSDLQELVRDGLAARLDGEPITVDFTSLCLHVSSVFIRYKPDIKSLSLPSNAETELVPLNEAGLLEFPPGAAILACTIERVHMPLDYMGFIQTKGTIARGFVMVHLCDGQIDPGYQGQITLELVNLSGFNYTIAPGTAIAQLFLHRLETPVPSGYNGRYQQADGPTSMRLNAGSPN